MTYAPDTTFAGADTFTYQLRDGNGFVDDALVAVVITPQAEDTETHRWGPPTRGHYHRRSIICR